MKVDELGDRKLIFLTRQLTQKGNTKKRDNSVYFLTKKTLILGIKSNGLQNLARIFGRTTATRP